MSVEPTKITNENIEAAVDALSEGLPFRMDINGFGGPRRMVVAPFHDTQELMVAVEGGGCAFLEESTRHNRFIFIQHGFQMPHAVAVEALLSGVADYVEQQKAHIASLTSEPLQIEDQTAGK